MPGTPINPLTGKEVIMPIAPWIPVIIIALKTLKDVLEDD
jgi:hypothetical protein